MPREKLPQSGSGHRITRKNLHRSAVVLQANRGRKQIPVRGQSHCQHQSQGQDCPAAQQTETPTQTQGAQPDEHRQTAAEAQQSSPAAAPQQRPQEQHSAAAEKNHPAPSAGFESLRPIVQGQQQQRTGQQQVRGIDIGVHKIPVGAGLRQLGLNLCSQFLAGLTGILQHHLAICGQAPEMLSPAFQATDQSTECYRIQQGRQQPLVTVLSPVHCQRQTGRTPEMPEPVKGIFPLCSMVQSGQPCEQRHCRQQRNGEACGESGHRAQTTGQQQSNAGGRTRQERRPAGKNGPFPDAQREVRLLAAADKGAEFEGKQKNQQAQIPAHQGLRKPIRKASLAGCMADC